MCLYISLEILEKEEFTGSKSWGWYEPSLPELIK